MRNWILPLLLLLTACSGNLAGRPGTEVRPQVKQNQPLQQIQPVPALPSAALLLPLSGANAALGQNLLQAAEMALFDSPNSNLQLLPIDTNPSPENALASAQTRGANVVIGPVFGQEARRIANGAEQTGLNVLALTNDRSLAQPGLYVMGVTPESQIHRVIFYAASQGIKKYAALLPDTLYGQVLGATLQAEAQNAGGQILSILTYPPNTLDYTAYVQKLVDLHKTQPFDGLLLGEGGAKAKSLAGLTRTLGLQSDQVRILGTSLLHDAATDPALQGAWYAMTPPERWQNFANRYRQLFNENPDLRGLVIYDSVSLMAGLNDVPFRKEQMQNPDGYAGLSGLFRLKPDGSIERGLVVLEANPAGAVLKDPAPQSFAPVLN